MRVEVSSVLPASSQQVWGLLERSSTLAYIARPMVEYRGELPPLWRVGETVDLRPQRPGDKEPGSWIVRFTRIDRTTGVMQTEEFSTLVRSWKHTMIVLPVGDERCSYTDIIEIGAGPRNPFVWWWARKFYRHRHRRWLELLREVNAQVG